MKKCAIILPYFGKFNNYFPLFLRSCAYNPAFDWLIFTDDKSEYEYPENVHVHYITFEDMQKLIQSKFKFEVSLEHPYKLCDYKATYGLVFKEYIEKYDFWGFCDCDLIFGDLSQFITDEILNEYDRVFSLGHFSLFKNDNQINSICLDDYNGEKYAPKVLGSNNVFGFDEMVMNSLLEQRGMKIYSVDLSANLSVYYHKFRLVKRDYSIKRYIIEDYIPAIYLWDRGKVIRFFISDDDGTLTKNEFVYIHLQQRNMKWDDRIRSADCVQILPNKFDLFNKDVTVHFREIRKSEFDVKSIKKSFLNLMRWKIKCILSHKMPGKFLRGNI